MTEVNVLGVVEHPNLVKLVGYCAEDDERGIQRLLIYEYMPNGSVENHLSNRSDTPLSWDMRLRIAQDAARGLTYLHEEMDFQVLMIFFSFSIINKRFVILYDAFHIHMYLWSHLSFRTPMLKKKK